MATFVPLHSWCLSMTIVSSFQPPMFRKFSKSSASSKPPTSQAAAAQPVPYQPYQPWPRQRLKTASDSNLPASRRNDKANVTLAPKPGGITKESRPRRSTIASSGPSQRPAVSSPKPLPAIPANARIGRKIVEYMPELYEEVDPIRLTGRFYTWEDPSWLNYVPLPPPPRKNVKFGRILSKPKHEPGVCPTCTSKRGFSCGSSHHEPEIPAPPPSPS
ncbi:hypothetical protein C8R44DRAFT_138218 [Mycena epipterygia]|nr:hypothetical protein C8R44DRAFT_138218 [Mycena epipterygia]